MSTKKKSTTAPKKFNGKEVVFNALHLLGCPVKFEFVAANDGSGYMHSSACWEQLNRDFTLKQLHDMMSKVTFVNCADTFVLVSAAGQPIKFAKGKRPTRRCTSSNLKFMVLAGIQELPKPPAAGCPTCHGPHND